MKRNNISYEDAVNRINNQIPLVEKIKRADYVIYNNGSLDEVWLDIDKILKGVII